MIEATHTVAITVPIERVWNYVQDIRKWATLFPGCRECEVIDDTDSRWIIKVGAGGLIKTVNVLVHVNEWAGPTSVDFNFQLEGEPVKGGGTYRATRNELGHTEVGLKVRVEGSGPMAPMWEAVSKPLLPQMARSFADKLKQNIEAEAATVVAPLVVAPPSALAAALAWLRGVWRAMAGAEPMQKADGAIAMSEQNKKVVLVFIDAMGRSDGASAIPCLDPEAFTLAKGFGKFAGVRQYATIVGTIDAFQKLLPTGLRPKIESVTAEADRVVVEFEGNAVAASGEQYNNQYCMVFTMRDGKIKQVNEYFCTILADRVLWPLVESMQNEIPAN